MAELLRGKAVADSLGEKTIGIIRELSARGVRPALAIVRLGEGEDDLSYERGIIKRAEKLGIASPVHALPEDCGEGELLSLIEQLNGDASVHGILLMRPLPKGIDENRVRNALAPEKDVDGITDLSLAGVFTHSGRGFPPCTARSCLEMLRYYGVELPGKRVTLLGRSLVVGRPLAMMLLAENATVTLCHTRTVDVAKRCAEAEILVASAGKMGLVDESFLSAHQIVLDVGIHQDGEGKIRGDVDEGAAERIVGAYSPVPGGVGSVTTAVLLLQTAEAALIQKKSPPPGPSGK